MNVDRLALAVSAPPVVAAEPARSRFSHAAAARASLLGTVGASLGVVGLNAVQGVLLARMLGPEGRGAYSTVVFYTQTFVFIGLLGSTFALARRAAQGHTVGPLRNAAWRFSLITAAITATVVCLLATLALPPDKRHLLLLSGLCVLLLPAEHLRRMLLAVDQGRANLVRYNVGQLLGAATLPTLLILGWFTGTASLAWAVAFTILAPWLALIFLESFGNQPRLRWSPARPPAAILAREGRPYLVAVLIDDLFNRLDMLLVLWLASFAVQGYYAAAVPAAGLLCSAPAALAVFAFNAGAKPGANLSLRRLIGLTMSVLLLQTASALLLAAMLEPLMLLVYGHRFEAAIPFAIALLPANALYGCTQVAEGYLRGRNRNRTSIWSRLLGAVVMGLAVLGLWADWQIMAIPFALALGQAAILLCLSAAVLVDVLERAAE